MLRHKIGAMRRASLWAVLLMMLAHATGAATCLVLVVENDRVLLAGDGLETHIGSAPTHVCKIATGPRAAVAVTGLVANSNTGLNLSALARHAVLAGGVDIAAGAFATSAQEALQQELIAERSRAPGVFLDRLCEPLATVVFAGIERGCAMAVVQRFSTSCDGEVEQLPTQQVTTDSAPRILVFCNAAAEYMRCTPTLRRLEPAKLAATLIRHAISMEAAGAETIGPPVAVLEMRQSGPRWIEPGACQSPAARVGRLHLQR